MFQRNGILVGILGVMLSGGVFAGGQADVKPAAPAPEAAAPAGGPAGRGRRARVRCTRREDGCRWSEQFRSTFALIFISKWVLWGKIFFACGALIGS